MKVDAERGSLLLKGTLEGSLEASLANHLEEAHDRIGRLTDEIAVLRERIRILEAKE